MRAVNLLPSDLRGTAPAAAPSAGQERAEGIGAYVVLGALALCVAMLAVYVLATNTVKQKQATLEEVTAQAHAASAETAKLKPYADFDAMAKTRVETVKGLAAARFDWEQAFRDLSRSVPSDVKLQSLSGDMGLPGTTGGGATDPLRGSISAPAISLAGCAQSQPAVARMMARLRAVDGVTRVALSKSESSANAAASATAGSTPTCSGKNPPSFSVVVFFERSAALANMAPAEANAATASTVPVPKAVSGSSGTSGTAGSAPSATPSGAADAANSASAATTASSTPNTGATP
jgi:Tfp pilus assembly protein PilN